MSDHITEHQKSRLMKIQWKWTSSALQNLTPTPEYVQYVTRHATPTDQNKKNLLSVYIIGLMHFLFVSQALGEVPLYTKLLTFSIIKNCSVDPLFKIADFSNLYLKRFPMFAGTRLTFYELRTCRSYVTRRTVAGAILDSVFNIPPNIFSGFK